MKSTALVITLVIMLVSTFCLITWNGFSEAWAKGPAGNNAQSGNTSRVATPPANTGASSSSDVQAKKKSSGDKLKYMEYKMQDAFITN